MESTIDAKEITMIWGNVELPRLMNNPNVTKITVIDPKTGIETVIFER